MMRMQKKVRDEERRGEGRGKGKRSLFHAMPSLLIDYLPL